MVTQLALAAAVVVTLGSTVAVGGAVNAALPSIKLVAGSKWTVESELCPIREIIGSSGHLTFALSNPKRHVPGKYKTSGETITEKAPGYLPGPLAFSGKWSRAEDDYVGTLTNGSSQVGATLGPGFVNGCPA